MASKNGLIMILIIRHFLKSIELLPRVPRRYRRQLRKDQLIVQITSADGKVVDGGVAKHYGLTTEMFSGLLLPESDG